MGYVLLVLKLKEGKMHVLSDCQRKVHYFVLALKFILWIYSCAMAKQHAHTSRVPGSILSLSYCLGGISHVLPVSMWVFAWISSFLQPSRT